MAFRDSEEFKRGHNGEKIVARVMQHRGCFVIASYDYSGEDGNKAPKMEGLLEKYVIPDLDVSKEGKRYWVEVKTKTERTWTRVTQQFEHGIPWRHYQHYKEVETITGSTVFLAVYELDSQLVLIRKLNDLGEPRYSKSDRMGEMAFWPCDAFTVLTDLTSRSDY